MAEVAVSRELLDLMHLYELDVVPLDQMYIVNGREMYMHSETLVELQHQFWLRDIRDIVRDGVLKAHPWIKL